MTEFQIASIVSLLGFLILVVGGYRSRRVEAKRTLTMIGIWVAIFGIVALFIVAVE